jgi:hypothetical protein
MYKDFIKKNTLCVLYIGFVQKGVYDIILHAQEAPDLIFQISRTHVLIFSLLDFGLASNRILGIRVSGFVAALLFLQAPRTFTNPKIPSLELPSPGTQLLIGVYVRHQQLIAFVDWRRGDERNSGGIRAVKWGRWVCRDVPDGYVGGACVVEIGVEGKKAPMCFEVWKSNGLASVGDSLTDTYVSHVTCFVYKTGPWTLDALTHTVCACGPYTGCVTAGCAAYLHHHSPNSVCRRDLRGIGQNRKSHPLTQAHLS